LYLVFNTKNKEDAKETVKGLRKFPPWVEVYTTNSFLGRVLGDNKNLDKIPQTERIAELTKGEGERKIEKSRIMADSADFERLMQQYGMPDSSAATPNIVASQGITGSYQNAFLSALKGILTGIRYEFKERGLTLLGLLKSFGVIPTIWVNSETSTTTCGLLQFMPTKYIGPSIMLFWPTRYRTSTRARRLC
jgi:hypothetical protein